MLQAILLSISFVSFITYIIFIWSKYGVLPSISDSFYKTKNAFSFYVFILSVALPLMIAGDTGLMFSAGALLTFVGAAAAFKDKLTGTVHVIGAIGGILLGFLSMIVDFHLWYITAIELLFIGIAYLIKMKNKTWWVEIVSFILIMIGLLISMF